MSERAGGSSKSGGGKKPHKNKPTSKKYEHYKLSGQKAERDKVCVKCGPGIFLAKHKDRLYCGRCHYTEFSQK